MTAEMLYRALREKQGEPLEVEDLA